MAERGMRNVESREDPLDEPDHLWIPPAFLKRQKSLGNTVRWLRFTEDYVRMDRRLQMRFQQGWEFVKPDDIPEWKNPPIADFGKFASLIAIGDVALAICPKRITDQLVRMAEKKAADLKAGVKNNFRSSDSKLNKYTPVSDDSAERTTTGGRATKFGD